MSNEEVVVLVECDEPEGIVTRKVRPLRLDMDKLRELYGHLNQFDVLFNAHFGNDIDAFINSFFCIADGDIQPLGLIWEIDDVGIFVITDISPGFEALMHFTFWDRRFRGREGLMREIIKFVMSKFSFHRITTEVPLYAPPTMGFVERIGFSKEGRKRQVVRYKGNWFDANLYSIVEGDFDVVQA